MPFESLDIAGTSVAINGSGNRIAVGSPGSDSGEVELFDWNGSEWTLVGAPIIHNVVSSPSRFGSSLALSNDGNRLISGNPIRNFAAVYDEASAIPSALCQNIELELADENAINIQPIDLDAGSNNYFGDISLSISQSEFSCLDIGDNSVVLTVTNGNDFSESCVSIVSVIDSAGPNMLCKDTLIVDLDGILSDESIAVQAFLFNEGSYDNCIEEYDIQYAFSEELSDSLRAFGCRHLGTQELQIWGIDTYGNTSSCNSMIMITDTTNICMLSSDSESTQKQNNLYQNMPNPFGTKTIIPFDLDEAKYVQLIIMDNMGRVVEELSGDFNEGYNELLLERSFNPGVYFYQISAEGFSDIKKMIVLR